MQISSSDFGTVKLGCIKVWKEKKLSSTKAPFKNVSKMVN